MALRIAVQNDVALSQLVENADHVVLIIPGIDCYGGLVLGWGGGKYVSIYGHVTRNVLAHEFGHCFGLADEYTPNLGATPISGEDRDNVMNMAGVGAGNRFRYQQWKTINEE